MTDDRNPMIILSFDAVGTEDLPYLKTLPHFSRFWREGAMCEKVKSVYPSLTYPAHTTIVTGRYPSGHGVVNNIRFQPKRVSPDWFWQRKYIRGETLYDAVRKNGGKTAALLWPVTGRGKIRYNLPEVFPNRKWQNQIMVSAWNGSLKYELELEKRFGSLRKGIRQPELDHFVQASLLYTVERYRPDLTLVHFTDVDTNRHLYGVDSREAKEALHRHDGRLGALLDLLDQMGWGERANVVILGDHYQKNVEQAVCPNYFFRKHNWIEIKNGRIHKWKVLAWECDGSCYIYVKDKNLTGQVMEVLQQMVRQHLCLRIYRGKEAAAMGADPDCTFMLEGVKGTYFQNGWKKPVCTEKAKLQKATHGYHPDGEGYTTFFGGKGPDFKRGGWEETMDLIDEGPTLAAALKVRLDSADGIARKKLLSISSDRVYNKK